MPTTRRAILASVAVSGTTLLAGCSSGDGSNGSQTGPNGTDGNADQSATPTQSSESTPTRTPSSSHTREDRGSIKENEVEGLTVVGWTSTTNTDASSLTVEVTLRNDGNSATAAGGYGYLLYVYDSSGNKIQTGATSIYTDDTKFGPGETSTVKLRTEVQNLDAVSSYAISVFCSNNSDGVYCS